MRVGFVSAGTSGHIHWMRGLGGKDTELVRRLTRAVSAARLGWLCLPGFLSVCPLQLGVANLLFMNKT